MINALLNLFNFEIRKLPTKNLKHFPDIRFTTGDGTITETIIECGWEMGDFYILTDNNKLIYIDDKYTENQIYYGEPEDLVDISDMKVEF